MTARIVLVGADSTGLGEPLAEAIRAAHVLAPAGGAEMEILLGATTDGFVLEGYPLNVAQAERLDAFLDAKAASIEIALWVRPDAGLTSAAPSPADDELLSHYRGRVVEVDAAGVADERELLARAVDGIREATASLVG